jgi:hypothetical protein
VSEQDDLIRARQAMDLLESPAFTEAFENIERNILRQWRDSKPGDTTEREWLFHQMRAVDLLRQHLTRQIDRGKVIAATRAERDEGGARTGHSA